MEAKASKYRGSSKVLSQSPFSPFYDDEWFISINVDMVKSYGRRN
jgi:hypothetical protein